MTAEDSTDSKPDNPSPLARLEQARQLLAPAREILDRFNYKHKNQHRLSKWWAAFDTLRRHLAKLERDGITPAVGTLELAVRRSGSKRPRDPVVGSAAMPPGVEAKSRWMRDYLIPRAYSAFTQLAADNQFAHLGLLLLGVLAQVHELVSLILPPRIRGDAADGAECAAASPLAIEARSVPAVGTATLVPAAVSTHRDDLGVAVSRDNVAPAKCDVRSRSDNEGMPLSSKKREKQTSPKSGLSEEASRGRDEETKPVGDGPLDASAAKPKVKKKARKDDAKEEKKKKKKKKKGDEFDDLFSSLM
ncbi:hypothetical protein RB595_000698 [Gaeumannomyces hyphopodioides]